MSSKESKMRPVMQFLKVARGKLHLSSLANGLYHPTDEDNIATEAALE